MSEYQYYEFRALDRPLSSDDQRHLRSLSSRAEITSSRFTNAYEWGDFKGDPLSLMHRCFDLHLYYANWGTRTLMLRVPEAALDGIDVAAYEAGGGVDVRRKAGHAVVEFGTSPEDGYDENFNAYDQPDDLAGDLQPVRDLLLAGDLRPLYIGWLSAVPFMREADLSKPEPPLPAGMGQLPKVLAKLAGFLGVDEDLLAIAASPSPPLPAGANEGDAGAVVAWAAGLPAADKDAVIAQVLAGEGQGARTALLARYRRERAGTAATTVRVDRTPGDMLLGAEAVAATRREMEAAARKREAARKAAVAAANRERFLRDLAARYDAAWARAASDILLGASGYPDVARALVDLRDAARLSGRTPDFNDRMAALLARYAKRPALLERLRKAGLVTKGSGAA